MKGPNNFVFEETKEDSHFNRVITVQAVYKAACTVSPIIWESHSRPIVFLKINYNKQTSINGGMLK